jgi:class 3 adenylate cyclase
VALHDELEEDIVRALATTWDLREGQVVPTTDDVALGGGGVRLDATVLYADLAESSTLVNDVHRQVAAKVMKSYLACSARIIADQGGAITSYDGDRIMGVFVGSAKNTCAVRAGLMINYVVHRLLRPELPSTFRSLARLGFRIRHGVGIDTSEVLVVRAGRRGENDLIWVGRAANMAAALSGLRVEGGSVYISADVHRQAHVSVKRVRGALGLGGFIWDAKEFLWKGNTWPIRVTNYCWRP